MTSTQQPAELQRRIWRIANAASILVLSKHRNSNKTRFIDTIVAEIEGNNNG